MWARRAGGRLERGPPVTMFTTPWDIDQCRCEIITSVTTHGLAPYIIGPSCERIHRFVRAWGCGTLVHSIKRFNPIRSVYERN